MNVSTSSKPPAHCQHLAALAGGEETWSMCQSAAGDEPGHRHQTSCDTAHSSAFAEGWRLLASFPHPINWRFQSLFFLNFITAVKVNVALWEIIDICFLWIGWRLGMLNCPLLCSYLFFFFFSFNLHSFPIIKRSDKNKASAIHHLTCHPKTDSEEK